jgi:uncharacterized protein (UPF0212 family)
MGYALTAADLLNVWERGRSQSPVHRSLSLLQVAIRESTREALAQVGIGRRDAELLKLREKIFGSCMTGHANCPACGQQMEMNFTVAEVQTTPLPELPETCTEIFGDCEISFRLPNSSDLATLVPGDNLAIQKRRLVQLCVLNAKSSGQPVVADQLLEDTVTALSERMSELDPQGDVQLALSCPQCSHHWDAPLDIASFVWSEIHAWAVRLLRDVHVLASAYGWRERDILAMSSWRRQAYLELIER